MPHNAKEGILFSFVMSAIMIYAMAALNYLVRDVLGMNVPLSQAGAADAWIYAAAHCRCHRFVCHRNRSARGAIQADNSLQTSVKARNHARRRHAR